MQEFVKGGLTPFLFSLFYKRKQVALMTRLFVIQDARQRNRGALIRRSRLSSIGIPSGRYVHERS